MESLQNIVATIDEWVWGYFLMFLLVGTGVFLTFRLRFVQFRFFRHAWSLITGKWDDPKAEGEITHFGALSTALAATVGTGNIAGVATAISSGGPGAVFWMWVTAVVGMCTKFTCCMLAQSYREIDKDGEVAGGPMYYLHNGLKLPWLGFFFALFTIIASFGIGNLVQANSVANPLYDYIGIPKWLIGSVLAVLVAVVILGGIKRIAVFAEAIVPFMAIVYVLGAAVILILNVDKVPDAFLKIIGSAFGIRQIGGGVLGYGVAQAMRFGIARGLFSNESGLGSAAIAHAAAKTKEPVREGMVAMLGPFIDTIVICTMTALVVIISGLYGSGDITGASLTAAAFDDGLPSIGKHIVSFGLIFFAFSTMVSWSYYGDRSIKYIFEHEHHIKRAVLIYRLIYVLAIPIGATMSLRLIWNLSDIANGLMAFPNLIALLGLSGVAALKLKNYEKRYPSMKPFK